MKYKIHLDTNEINNLIEELNYYSDSLSAKCQKFVEKLCDYGIEVARTNTGEYGSLIWFRKELDPTESGCKAIMIATDKMKVIREWKYHGSTKTAEVSPILMAEFGSGWLAENLDNVEGVGQGTFPDQTHAFDPRGWWWTDTNGEHHHSMGEAPTFPMHTASIAMLFEMQSIAEEVFNG